jgi:hypothetical protein
MKKITNEEKEKKSINWVNSLNQVNTSTHWICVVKV